MAWDFIKGRNKSNSFGISLDVPAQLEGEVFEALQFLNRNCWHDFPFVIISFGFSSRIPCKVPKCLNKYLHR